MQLLINQGSLTSGKCDLNRFCLFCLVPLVFLLSELLIILFSILLTLNVPDEGYSRNVSCAQH